MEPLKLKEHDKVSLESLSDDLKGFLSTCRLLKNGYMEPPKYLGLGWKNDTILQASYYIGASWLVENESRL